ncbi:hypothetical protein V8C86DRAFT_2532283 [Haematococcus lacustris]
MRGCTSSHAARRLTQLLGGGVIHPRHGFDQVHRRRAARATCGSEGACSLAAVSTGVELSQSRGGLPTVEGLFGRDSQGEGVTGPRGNSQGGRRFSTFRGAGASQRHPAAQALSGHLCCGETCATLAAALRHISKGATGAMRAPVMKPAIMGPLAKKKKTTPVIHRRAFREELPPGARPAPHEKGCSNNTPPSGPLAPMAAAIHPARCECG